MNSITRSALLVSGLVLGLAALPAQADEITTLTLSDVTMNDGGSLTGSFQLDDTTSSLTDIDISMNGSSTYADTTFTSTSSIPSFCTTCSPSHQPEFRIFQSFFDVYFDINNPLVLNGSNALIPDPGNADIASDVDGPSGDGTAAIGFSGVLDASTTNVPEPPSLPMFLMALGILGGAFYFGRKKAMTC